MSIYMYTYIYVYMYTFICIYVHINIHIYIHTAPGRVCDSIQLSQRPCVQRSEQRDSPQYGQQ